MAKNFNRDVAELFGKNLKDLIDSRGIMQRQLADAINASEGSVTNWIAGMRFPGPVFIDAMAKYFDVPVSSFFSAGEEQTTFAYQAKVPLLKEGSRAESSLAFAEQYVQSGSMPGGADFAFMATSDEMAPVIKPGDLVFCSKQDAPPENLQHYVIVVDGRYSIRRAHCSGTHVTYIAENSAYPPISVSLDDNAEPAAKVIGKLVFIQRAL